MTTLQLVAEGWRRQFGRIDRAWLAVAVLFAGLFLLVPDQGWRTAAFTGEALVEIAPYLVLAVAAAAYAKASGADNLIARAFRGHIAMMILFAALMGAVSPFCSCGVIPLIAALLSMGVPLAAVMAFWLSSPLMDPSMFVLTAGTLGTGGDGLGLTLAYLLGCQVENLTEAIARWRAFESLLVLVNGVAWALLTPILVGLLLEGLIGALAARPA